jgi:hypothetical protein
MPGVSKQQGIESAVNTFLQQYCSVSSMLSGYLQQGNLRMWLKTVNQLLRVHAPKKHPEAKAEAFASMMSDMLLNVYGHIDLGKLKAFAERAAMLIAEQLAEYKKHLMSKVAVKALCAGAAPDLDVACPHMTRLNILLTATQSLGFDEAAGEICLAVEFDQREKAARLGSIFFAGREYLPINSDVWLGAEKPEPQSKRSGFWAEVLLLPMSRIDHVERATHHFGKMLDQEDCTDISLALADLKTAMFYPEEGPGDHVSKRLAYVRSATDLVKCAIAEGASSASCFEPEELAQLKTNCIVAVKSVLLLEIQALSAVKNQPAVISAIMVNYARELRDLPRQIERAGVVQDGRLHGFVVLHHSSYMIAPQRFAHGPKVKEENKWVQYGPKATLEALCDDANPSIIFAEFCPAYCFPVNALNRATEVEFSAGYLRKCQLDIEGAYVLPAVPAGNQKARPSGNAKAIILGLAGRPDEALVSVACDMPPDELTGGIALLGLNNEAMPEYVNAVPRLFGAFGKEAPAPLKKKSRVKKIDWVVDKLSSLLLDNPWCKVQRKMFFTLAEALIGLYERQGLIDDQALFLNKLADRLNALNLADRARMPGVLRLVCAVQVFSKPAKGVKEAGYEADRANRREALRTMAEYFDEPFKKQGRPHNVNKWLSMLPKMMRWSLKAEEKYQPGVACLKMAIMHVKQHTKYGATDVDKYASQFSVPAGFFAGPIEKGVVLVSGASALQAT